MRVAIISDVHANLATLEALREPYDVLLCLGDLVDYGPHPQEVLQWVRERASSVVRGNHDHALAYHVDCRCAQVMKDASITTRTWHAQLLTTEEKTYLHELPLSERVEFGGATFFLAHASPAGDLYAYLRPNVSDEERIRGEVILVLRRFSNPQIQVVLEDTARHNPSKAVRRVVRTVLEQ